MNNRFDVDASGNGALKRASWDHLACLLRHWTWANEAMVAFDRELAGPDDQDDPLSDRPFGAFYHWCALLCAFGEAALEHGLLSPSQIEPIRRDLETSMPILEACRHLLVVVPASLEDRPLVVNLVRDGKTLPGLRRLHHAFGAALRGERASREIDSLDS
jgi:hypothetical protein